MFSKTAYVYAEHDRCKMITANSGEKSLPPSIDTERNVLAISCIFTDITEDVKKNVKLNNFSSRLFPCKMKEDISFQKLENVWVSKVLSPYILFSNAHHRKSILYMRFKLIAKVYWAMFFQYSELIFL